MQYDLIKKANPNPEAELAVLQLGPLVIGSAPCEMFAQYALDFKAQSKFPFTWFSELQFHYRYIPTADAFDPVTGGGYEVSSAKFIPETGDEIVNIISELSRQLEPEAVPAPELVRVSNTPWGYNFKRKTK